MCWAQLSSSGHTHTVRFQPEHTLAHDAQPKNQPKLCKHCTFEHHNTFLNIAHLNITTIHVQTLHIWTSQYIFKQSSFSETTWIARGKNCSKHCKFSPSSSFARNQWTLVIFENFDKGSNNNFRISSEGDFKDGSHNKVLQTVAGIGNLK